MSTRPITIFADFTCPFCYVTEAGLLSRAERGELELRPHAFELYPPPTTPPAPAEEPEWEALVRPLAEELELSLRVPRFRPRTRKAHEAARFAEEHGAGAAMRRALYAAFWAQERDIGRIDVLLELAGGCGLDATDLKIALDIDRHLEEVVHDQALARRLRITGVPTLFIGTGPQARVLVGAQSPAALDAALEDS